MSFVGLLNRKEARRVNDEPLCISMNYTHTATYLATK